MSGNIFKDSTAVDHTTIPSIISTINELLHLTTIPVGSSATPIPGNTSGDIDVIVDEKSILEMFNTTNSKSGRKALYNYIVQKGYTAAQTGSIVHVQLPFNNQLHQVDIMVVADAESISKFHIHKIPKNSPYKGMNKHLLIHLIAKEQGYFWSPWQGLFERVDNKKGQFISNNVNEIAKILLNSSASSLDCVESILNSFPKTKSAELLSTIQQDPNWKERIKSYGRTFNHLEDLTIFYGSAGAYEALAHIIEITEHDGAASVRVKWDGGNQIYWGRETINGPLIFCNHNAWSRKIKLSSSDEVLQFIAHRSGVASPERTRFAKHFASLYHIFDAATPSDFVGFVYADALYTDLSQVTTTDENFFITPNPKSLTSYTIFRYSNLGIRIANSDVMIVGHAYYSVFGQAEDQQNPCMSFEMFNTKQLIAMSPIYTNPLIPIELGPTNFTVAREVLDVYKDDIDRFINAKVTGLSDLKDIIYRYFNQTAKNRDLVLVSVEHFFNWLSTSNVSASKQSKIHTLHLFVPLGLSKLFRVIRDIRHAKDDIIFYLTFQLSRSLDIEIHNGEGFVRYADSTKKFGHIKLVPRDSWVPE